MNKAQKILLIKEAAQEVATGLLQLDQVGGLDPQTVQVIKTMFLDRVQSIYTYADQLTGRVQPMTASQDLVDDIESESPATVKKLSKKKKAIKDRLEIEKNLIKDLEGDALIAKYTECYFIASMLDKKQAKEFLRKAAELCENKLQLKIKF